MILALLTAFQAAAAPLDVYGRWEVPADEGEGYKAIVEVRDCPDAAGTPCGFIDEIPEDRGADAQAWVGTKLLWGFEEGDDAWEDGQVLDPEADRTYDGSISRDGQTLAVEGCVAFFCRTMNWAPAGERAGAGPVESDGAGD